MQSAILKALMAMFTPAQIGNLVRNVASPLAIGIVAWASAKGWISKEDSAQLVAALIILPVILAQTVWSGLLKTESAQIAAVKELPNQVVVQTAPNVDKTVVLQAISEVPNVDKVTTTATLADLTPSAKVVSA